MRFALSINILMLGLIIGLGIIFIPRLVHAVTIDPEVTTIEFERDCESHDSIRDYAKCRVIERWDESQWGALDYIITRESGWCSTKWNGQKDCPDVPREYKLPGRSSAFGLCQTMMSLHDVGKGFKTNERAQIDWCIGYAAERYGNLIKAKEYWVINKHW